ncbi:hypothetical protein C8R42DRAFT_724155 [Lentinula raphanica]|nr:hypothetical protein C8R42DRAFT_645032 [Lentinula raphanica]KAJ3717945.1 hypothetical protein C8R42DRAFT_724155 [Lentinula raphanica]
MGEEFDEGLRSRYYTSDAEDNGLGDEPQGFDAIEWLDGEHKGDTESPPVRCLVDYSSSQPHEDDDTTPSPSGGKQMGHTSPVGSHRIVGVDEDQRGESENEDQGYEKASEDEDERKIAESECLHRRSEKRIGLRRSSYA